MSPLWVLSALCDFFSEIILGIFLKLSVCEKKRLLSLKGLFLGFRQYATFFSEIILGIFLKLSVCEKKNV